MELLQEITEKDVGISGKGIDFSMGYKVRQAARAVVIDKDGNLPILFDSRHNHHKIPGGGVDSGETINEALKREVMEEAGCKIKILNEIGLTIEYRNKYKLLQISYCFLAQVVGQPTEPKFDKEEIADGYRIKWAKIDGAIKLFKNDKPKEYSGPFMLKRDFDFLLKAKKLL